MLTTVAVVVGGILLLFWPIYWIDPLLTILISFYLILSSWKLLSETTKILMLFAPNNIDIDLLKDEIQNFAEIKDIHHVHLWTFSDNQTHLEAHLSFNKNLNLKETNQICVSLEEKLKALYPIHHITFQAEFDPDCQIGITQHH
jgi:cobalt-zinc-cadmium efflux system protein